MPDPNPYFVDYPRPPAGAPNVVMIVLDDVGFAQLGCFGSPIRTPYIDALAREGLRYNRFHTTAVCSATRASLLTGRNHHAVGMASTTEGPMATPGRTARIPKSAAMLPRILRDNGYNTMAIGKWHLCPRGEESASGPMDRWPLGMGFERFYGFMGGETSQWDPPMYRDNTPVDPPKSPEEGYHLTEDLADEAIRSILDQQQSTPDKPFFCYIAPGAAHAPHQVPAGWAEQYQGIFDDGWEALRDRIFERQVAEGLVPAGTTLTPRPPWVQDWAGLSDDERRLFARYMEVFAGFMTHTDAQIGRVIDSLRDQGILDDTLIIVCSDNGASAEGGQEGTINEPLAWLGQEDGVQVAIDRIEDLGTSRAFNHYPWAWAWAGNTPLQLWKRYTWLGGARTPLVVRWKGHTEQAGSVRSQFCHAVDIFSTVLDAIGIQPPMSVDGVTQQPIDGASIAGTFSDPAAPSPRDTQYFEMAGSRSIYHDGWKATTNYIQPLFGEREVIEGSDDLAQDHWALFDLRSDFSEAHDLADQEPDRLRFLQDLWFGEAGRNNVLPMQTLGDVTLKAHPAEFPVNPEVTYRPGGLGVCETQLPPVTGGFTAVATVEFADSATPAGAICAIGDFNEGWTFYLIDGKPATCLVTGGITTKLTGDTAVPAGVSTVTVQYRPDEKDNLQLLVNDEVVARGRHSAPVAFLSQASARGRFVIGRDKGLPFTADYEPPFPFAGILHKVVLRSERPQPFSWVGAALQKGD